MNERIYHKASFTFECDRCGKLVYRAEMRRTGKVIMMEREPSMAGRFFLVDRGPEQLPLAGKALRSDMSKDDPPRYRAHYWSCPGKEG